MRQKRQLSLLASMSVSRRGVPLFRSAPSRGRNRHSGDALKATTIVACLDVGVQEGFFFGSALSRGRNRHLGHASKATTIAACLGAASVLVSEMRTAPRKCNNRPLIATSADPCPDTRHSKANIWLSHTPVTAVGFFDARALALTADPCKKQGFVRMQHPCFCFISETVGLKS